MQTESESGPKRAISRGFDLYCRTMNAGVKWLNAEPVPGATMLLALSGWMDGGFVSTGTVTNLMRNRDLRKVAEVPPGGFYIDNFPAAGSMEAAAIFRPNVKYEDGLITHIDVTENIAYADAHAGLVFFNGREPSIDWSGFAERLFDIIRTLGVSRVVFIGSFGGSVPHTRAPRLYASVSHRAMLEELDSLALRRSNYEGPGHFASMMLHLAPRHDVRMMSLAVEIPGYLQGANPASIEAVTKRLVPMLGLQTDLTRLRKESTEWEHRVSREIAKDKDLAQTVRELEEQYDNELIQNTDLEETA